MVASDIKKIVSRLLIFFVGIPLVVILILCCSFKQHLVVNLILGALNVVASLELRTILSKKIAVPGKISTAFFSAILPLAMVLHISFNLGTELFSFIAVASIGVFFLRGIIGTAYTKQFIEKLGSSILLLVYPGMFSIWIMKIATLPYASSVMLVYVLSVFANDSLAWLFGMLFGKNNRGIFPVSPNKSIAGFIGGLSTAILVYVLASIFLPHFGITAFEAKFLPNILAAILLGLATGLATIAGDLVESALKRSTEVKDSGTIMHGRGGMLDSLDSLVFAAPVFWMLYRVLFV